MAAITVPTVFKSTDASAPVLNGLSYSLVRLLDAILVTGYGGGDHAGWSKAYTTSVAWGGVVGNGNVFTGTATDGANNKLIDTATNFGTCVTNGVQVGMCVIRDADGKFARISSISTTTNPNDTLNFTAVGTTTPTFANEDAYTIDSNRRMYKQPTGSNGFYLKIDDTGISPMESYSARATGVEGATDVDSGVQYFPTSSQLSGGCWVRKSASADGTARPWYCMTNGKIFYLVINTEGGAVWVQGTSFAFGDFTSFKHGDVYNTIIMGGTGIAYSNCAPFPVLSTSWTTLLGGHYVARSYTQSGLSVQVGKHASWAGSGNYIAYQGMTYPMPEDSCLYLSRVWINENGFQRGWLPGFWAPCHVGSSFTYGDVFQGAAGSNLAGRDFEIARMYYTNGAIAFETSDTWD